jgi:hypothetical protein
MVLEVSVSWVLVYSPQRGVLLENYLILHGGEREKHKRPYIENNRRDYTTEQTTIETKTTSHRKEP